MHSPVMLTTETDPRFFIAESTISGAGKGLFAKVPLAKGDSLEVVGVLVPLNSSSDQCTQQFDAYKFRVGDNLLIPLGFGGLINHSDLPNMEKILDGERLFLRTLRPIEKGEELLWTYSEFAQKRFKSASQASTTVRRSAWWSSIRAFWQSLAR